MSRFTRIAAIFGLAWLAAAQPVGAAETPKRGGVLTFLIPADAPPSFDGHRENRFATVHSVAPFYSNLIRAHPEHPSSPPEFLCDLSTALPPPTVRGK